MLSFSSFCRISGSIENAISSRDIKPSSSPSVERLLCSLENDLYENNVSSVLREAVAQVAQGRTLGKYLFSPGHKLSL